MKFFKKLIICLVVIALLCLICYGIYEYKQNKVKKELEANANEMFTALQTLDATVLDNCFGLSLNLNNDLSSLIIKELVKNFTFNIVDSGANPFMGDAFVTVEVTNKDTSKLIDGYLNELVKEKFISNFKGIDSLTYTVDEQSILDKYIKDESIDNVTTTITIPYIRDQKVWTPVINKEDITLAVLPKFKEYLNQYGTTEVPVEEEPVKAEEENIPENVVENKVVENKVETKTESKKKAFTPSTNEVIKDEVENKVN